MKMKKEQPTKKKSGLRMPVGIRMALIALLMAIVTRAGAVEREGVVVGRQPAGTSSRILIKVDKNSLRPFDHTIELFMVNNPNLPGSALSMMMQDGTVIRFEDSNMQERTGFKAGTQRQLLRVGEYDVLDIFPEWIGRDAFPYAEIYRQRVQNSGR